MGFDDILKAGQDDRNRREHERRQLRMGLTPACESLRENAEAAVRAAIQSIDDLQYSGPISAGLPPSIESDSVRRSFALTARTKSNSITFQIAGSVYCRLSDGRLTYERSALRIDASGLEFMPIRNAHLELDGVSGGNEDPSYTVDQTAFKAALEEAAIRISQGI
jgi:hypothetical protein